MRVNYFERRKQFEILHSSRYQPLNLGNEKTKEELNQLITIILNAKNVRKDGKTKIIRRGEQALVTFQIGTLNE